MKSISIYFPAGDFATALRNHAAGLEQHYGTHDQVALLAHDLRALGLEVTMYSFLSTERREEEVFPGIRVISLGAPDFAAKGLLRDAVALDRSDAIVPHFPNLELLHAVAARPVRSMAVLASSYNRRRPGALLFRWRTVRALNHPRFELIANHCLPSTAALASHGVDRPRLIAWDVPHRFTPASSTPKATLPAGPLTLAYAGSVNAAKGVGEVITAVSSLRASGADIRATIAGGGDVEGMRALAVRLGIADAIDFRGVIANRDVFALYQVADIAVVPSRWDFPEGFPLTMFEAIASHTPIVCSDHPMFRPIMTDRRRAMVYRAGDARALADAIGRAIADEPTYLALSNAADGTWQALSQTADWRTLIVKWVSEGANSRWIAQRMLDASA